MDDLRETQMANKEKPRYDGKCRHLADNEIDLSKDHVIRFKNPLDGVVTFKDVVKGEITIANKEMDDLIEYIDLEDLRQQLKDIGYVESKDGMDGIDDDFLDQLREDVKDLEFKPVESVSVEEALIAFLFENPDSKKPATDQEAWRSVL